MTAPGFVMLCHTALDRAADVARHLARQGAPVVIHLDLRAGEGALADMKAALAGEANIRFAPRFRIDWGRFSMVAATQAASEVMLEQFPAVSHVCLISGACLPLRPLEELSAYLAAAPGVDFIESVTTLDVNWAVGGLQAERFTLRFPFSWKRQQRAFDIYVRLQRRAAFRRRIPEGLVPHLGSQWWCLTRETLSAILTDPRRAEFDRYFRRVWIPDEAYFQTLARRHAKRIESRSLTLSKFDEEGRPHVFYDDHLQLLRRSDCFIARKIWPHAGQLYATFLGPLPADPPRAEPNPVKIDRLFTRTTERSQYGRQGLYMPGRYPRNPLHPTAAPYSVLCGFAELFDNWEIWLAKASAARVHGHLFAHDRVEFAGGEKVAPGGLGDSAAIRDYNPKSFLTSLIWNTRGERQCFQFGPADRQKIARFLADDPNATISVISGAWIVPLYRSGGDFAALRAEAARLQRVEAAFLALLDARRTRARVSVWTLADFIELAPDAVHDIVGRLSIRPVVAVRELPAMADLTGLGAFLQKLKNEGMKPLLMGDFPVAPELPRPAPSQMAAR